MDESFIYALCEPGTRTVRYIGKSWTPDRRFRQHLHTSSKKSNRFGEWLRGCLSSGREPALVILRRIPDRRWADEETRWITAARRLGMNLLNDDDGAGRVGGRGWME